MEKVIDCLGTTLDLTQIANICTITEDPIGDNYFFVVLLSGEKIKISSIFPSDLVYEREVLLLKWKKYKNSQRS